MPEDFERLPEPDRGPEEIDPIETAAHNAIFYRDLETATGTFAMQTGIGMILDSMRNGTPLDYERLQGLVEIMDAPSTTYTSYEEDGTVVSVVDGVEVERIPPSPEHTAWLKARAAEKAIVERYIDEKAPEYIVELKRRAASADEEASITLKVFRADKHEGMSVNSLEAQVFAEVRRHFRLLGVIFREEHKRVKPSSDSNEPDHTLHTLRILAPQADQ